MDKKKLLDEDKAVEVLTASKKTAKEISEKQKIAIETEVFIEESRQKYQNISSRISKLFFSVNDLVNIE